jgi:hypothetical protein
MNAQTATFKQLMKFVTVDDSRQQLQPSSYIFNFHTAMSDNSPNMHALALQTTSAASRREWDIFQVILTIEKLFKQSGSRFWMNR